MDLCEPGTEGALDDFFTLHTKILTGGVVFKCSCAQASLGDLVTMQVLCEWLWAEPRILHFLGNIGRCCCSGPQTTLQEQGSALLPSNLTHHAQNLLSCPWDGLLEVFHFVEMVLVCTEWPLTSLNCDEDFFCHSFEKESDLGKGEGCACCQPCLPQASPVISWHLQ